MIGNIVDRRSNKYNVEVDAAFEASSSDNTLEGASQFVNEGKIYDDLLENTVEKAIQKAIKYSIYVTVFLYDKGELSKEYNSEGVLISNEPVHSIE